MPLLSFSLDSGHMCNGVWRPVVALLCSRCRCWDGQKTHAIPSTLNKCSNCNSKWITDGKCDKCGTVMEWLKTDRPYYKKN